MERRFEDVFPLLDIEHDCILSKNGDITLAYEVELPEIFTRSNEEYETLHQAWIKAMKVLPKHSIFHKQDWYVEAKFRPDISVGKKSFLIRSSEAYFDGRPFLDHRSFVFLTKKPGARKAVTSASSSLMRKSIVPQQALDNQMRREFLRYSTMQELYRGLETFIGSPYFTAQLGESREILLAPMLGAFLGIYAMLYPGRAD